MMLKTLLSLSALLLPAAATVNFTEVVKGYKFITSGPNVALPQIEYEISAAHTALHLLKERLGSDGLASLLAPDIAAANAIWHEVIENSTEGQWVVAEARAVAFLPNLTAARFALWDASPFADAANNDANPEHYGKRTVQDADGVLHSEILEGWGGVTTLFSIPNYSSPPNRTAYPFLRPLPDYPFQAAGDKVLRDGTNARFGVLHISIRDVDGAEFGEKGNGVDVASAVWYPDGAQDSFLEGERQHMVIEIINLTLAAQKDIETGAFKPPV